MKNRRIEERGPAINRRASHNEQYKDYALLRRSLMYSIACWTVVIFSASSSGISVSNSSSRAITSSTVSSESAPRSSTNADSFLISASLTPSCSATIFLTRCSTLSMHYPPTRESKPSERSQFYQIVPPRKDGLLCHVHSAVDVQCRAGDIARLARGEECHRMRDVLRRAQAPERDALDELFAVGV